MKPHLDSTAFGISIVAFVLSILFSFILLPRLVQSHNVNLDADENGTLAYNIYVGNGMKYSAEEPLALDRGPVYPYLVAGLFFIAKGYSLGSVQFFQAVLHAATTYVLFMISLRLYHRRTALIVQLLCAMHPILLWYTGRIWIETTNAFMLTLSTLALIHLYEKTTLYRAVIVGVVLGITCLTKSVLIIFPFLALVLLGRRYSWPGVKHGVVVIVTSVLVIAPWSVRNWAIAQAFVPVQTLLGASFIQGDVIAEHWPKRWCCNLEFWAVGQARVDSLLEPRGIATLRSVEGDRLLVGVAIQRYVRDPGFYAYRTLANFFSFWSLSESLLKSVFYGALQWLLLLAATVAYICYGRNNPLLAPVVAITVYYIVLHALIIGWGRYSMPLIPFLIIMAAPLLERIRFRRAL